NKTDSSYRGDWFTLGDMGKMDADGDLFLTGRTAELIISGGVNIYPVEIDEVLIRHEAVAEWGLVRSWMQAGEYRRALAFSAHAAGAHVDVIEGAGLHLDTPDGTLAALPLQPLAFSGDLPVTSRMIDGPIRDFNLIWDAKRLSARVTTLSGALPACPAAPGHIYALLALTNGYPPLEVGALAIADQISAHILPDFRGLLVELQPKD
ncbi:MAG: HutD family protein, partial [Rhodobacteraceae bacterium]|nr:HutD family protein [Paracoccaceae bacterium]